MDHPRSPLPCGSTSSPNVPNPGHCCSGRRWCGQFGRASPSTSDVPTPTRTHGGTISTCPHRAGSRYLFQPCGIHSLRSAARSGSNRCTSAAARCRPYGQGLKLTPLTVARTADAPSARRRRAVAAHRLQGPGLRRVAERLQRRSYLPGPVHRRGRRSRVVSPAGAVTGSPASPWGSPRCPPVMLRLPLTSVLLTTLLLASDGLAVMPLVIVGRGRYVLSGRLTHPATGNTGLHGGRFTTAQTNPRHTITDPGPHPKASVPDLVVTRSSCRLSVSGGHRQT